MLQGKPALQLMTGVDKNCGEGTNLFFVHKSRIQVGCLFIVKWFVRSTFTFVKCYCPSYINSLTNGNQSPLFSIE